MADQCGSIGGRFIPEIRSLIFVPLEEGLYEPKKENQSAQ
jgi:hypothetical protein